MPVDKKLLREIALSEEEYLLLASRLGREPTIVELGMCGALWSEHCGYKHSKPLLSLFPQTSSRVLTKVGEENAGAVDIGDGWAVVMKMESHNHPSAIEPYQGAATGVGGILRDIFAMGARPIALLDSLRFGPLTDARNRYLFSGVVGGIGGYGNCIGIPTVAGETFFSGSYSANPLVNAMCVGLVHGGRMLSARAGTPGNVLLLVGADTGRDGLHGATFASVELDDTSEERRPAVQVGNPFMEKLLMEACLELAETDLLEGLQDLGAAGLTSSSVECASRGSAGIDIDVLKVPRREQGMSPYEVMLSESQERMLCIVKIGCEDKVKGVFDRWGLRSDVIGHVTGDGRARIREGERIVADIDIALLTDPPLYRRQGVPPEWQEEARRLNLSALPDVTPQSAGEVLLRLLASPNVCAKHAVFRQYDHQVGNNTVVLPGSDAAVLRVKGTRKAIALSSDANGRYCYLDPHQGGAIAVAEAARNLVCAGARPLAVTDCLNFGNPEKPEIYYQLEQCIRGMAEACRALDVPVISGNVSLYNETNGEAVYPTPVVGMVGLIEQVERACTYAFKEASDLVALLGGDGRGDAETLAGSEYLELTHGQVRGAPGIDLGVEARVQACCLAAVERGLLRSAHDCAEGGLAVALAESAVAGGVGFRGRVDVAGRLDAVLFGEGQSRIVVSLRPQALDELRALAEVWGAPVLVLGETGGDRFALEGLFDLPLSEAESAWRGGLERALAGEPA